MRFFQISFVVLMLCLSASAQSYYADVEVDVDSSGSATISGYSNHPLLKPSTYGIYTQKKGEYWLFNLTFPETQLFSQQVWAVRLPPDAQVNYVKSSSGFTITTEAGRVKIKDAAEDLPLSIIIQYQIRKEENESNPGFSALWPLLIIPPIIFAVFLLRKKKKVAAVEKADLSVLTDRQQEIMSYLQTKNEAVNQTDICSELRLPKSSVSRNLDTLESLGLIGRTKTGMSTMITLHKK